MLSQTIFAFFPEGVCVCVCVPAVRVFVNECVNSEAGENRVKVYVEVVQMDVSSH